MASEVRIEAPSHTLTRGEPTWLRVTIALDQPLKVRGIHATFRGAEETKADYTTTSTDSDGTSRTEHHTATEYVDVCTQAFLLTGQERLGLFGNFSDAIATLFGGGAHEVLEAGEYPFELEVRLPEDAPPTHLGPKSRVFYELSVQLDVPLARDLLAVRSFQVDALPRALPAPSPVRAWYPDDAPPGMIAGLFTPDVRIGLSLGSDQARVGEEIGGDVLVETPRALDCRAIRLRLVGVESSEAHGHTDRYVHSGQVHELVGPIALEGRGRWPFTLPVEAAGPPTARGARFSIDWFVQVELDVPWAKDPGIRAPILLLPRTT